MISSLDRVVRWSGSAGGEGDPLSTGFTDSMAGAQLVLLLQEVLYAQPFLARAHPPAPGAHHDERFEVLDPPEGAIGDRKNGQAHRDGEKGLEHAFPPA